MKQNNYVTEGPVLVSVLKLGWPVMISYLLYTGFSIIDAIWIGRLGPAALAASGPAQFASWSLIAAGEIIGIGATALIARRVGAGDAGRAGRVVAQAAVLVLGAGLVTLTTGSVVVRLLFQLLGTSAEVSRLGYQYLSVLFYGGIFSFAALFLESTLRAAGDTRTPLFITGSGLILNTVLDPLLIFGIGPFPEWGIRGAAVATVISQASIVVVFVLYFRSSRSILPVDLRAALRPDPSIWWKIVSIGTPASMITLLFTLVYLFLTSFLARFGTIPVAVLGVGNRLEGITYLVAHALSVAVSTLVGQNLGAGRPKRAASSAWLAAALGMGFGTLVAALFLLFPEAIFSLFTTDEEVIAQGAIFLKVLACCQTLMAVEVVMYGAFAGAGDTVPATVISVVFNALRIPAAWIVAVPLGYGPIGIWWMIAISCIIRSLLLAGWFRRNRWMRKVV